MKKTAVISTVVALLLIALVLELSYSLAPRSRTKGKRTWFASRFLP